MPQAIREDLAPTSAAMAFFDRRSQLDQLGEMQAGAGLPALGAGTGAGHYKTSGAARKAHRGTGIFVAAIGENAIALTVEFHVRKISHLGSERIVLRPAEFHRISGGTHEAEKSQGGNQPRESGRQKGKPANSKW
jgi:hypothetical protein